MKFWPILLIFCSLNILAQNQLESLIGTLNNQPESKCMTCVNQTNDQCIDLMDKACQQKESADEIKKTDKKNKQAMRNLVLSDYDKSAQEKGFKNYVDYLRQKFNQEGYDVGTEENIKKAMTEAEDLTRFDFKNVAFKDTAIVVKRREELLKKINDARYKSITPEQFNAIYTEYLEYQKEIKLILKFQTEKNPRSILELIIKKCSENESLIGCDSSGINQLKNSFIDLYRQDYPDDGKKLFTEKVLPLYMELEPKYKPVELTTISPIELDKLSESL